MTQVSAELDRQQLCRSFERAAKEYDGHAILQQEVGQRMLQRLEWERLQPATVIDLGCGTGTATSALAARFPAATVVGLDISRSMLQRLRMQQDSAPCPLALQADAACLPLATASCDLLFSNLMLQWCTHLELVFQEFRRVLRPGGLLLFSTLGPGTLHELRSSWSAVDDGAHVHAFIDMHDLGDGLLQAGLLEPVMDREDITLTYTQVSGLLKDIKGIGAQNARTERPRKLMGKARFKAMVTAYENFRQEGRIPATYEVLYGHAWVPANRQVDVPFQSELKGESGG